MINLTLYKREMKRSIVPLVIFASILTMYISIIIKMYDPTIFDTLEGFYEMMPEIMNAVGMRMETATLSGFMISYLYGFILLVFPMLFSILRGNALISKYVENHTMVTLVCSPIKRVTIVCTQLFVLLTGIIFLVVYATLIECVVGSISFPDEMIIMDVIKLNAGLLCLHLFIASICFFASCLFSDSKYSIAFGAGIPLFMYILQMLANVGEKSEFIKYFTFFTLFDANGIVTDDNMAYIKAIILLIGAIVLFIISIITFNKKDLSI